MMTKVIEHNMYKKPEQCEKMSDVRNAIDTIDKQVIELLGQRLQYIHRAADIKQSEHLIRDDERINSMLKVREQWAEEQGYDAQIIRQLFNDLIEYSVNKELNVWRKKN